MPNVVSMDFNAAAKKMREGLGMSIARIRIETTSSVRN